MKKLCFLILLELVFINVVFSSIVDTTTAKTVATNFFLSRVSQSSQQRVRSLAKKQIELELVHQEFENGNNQNNSEPYYYVYNVQGNSGFVIVSADDNVTPVLVHSFEGSYDVNNLPPAFVDWMENYKKQIRFIKANKLIQKSNIKSAWQRSMVKNTLTNNTTTNSIIPLLDKELIAWNQGCYYNLYCPSDNRVGANYCGNTPVGCNAVAMGQILRYWKYPQNSNTIPSYSDGDNKDKDGVIIPNSNYGTIPGESTTTYNWAYMQNHLTSSSSNLQKNEVSKLLGNCAKSIQMNFGPYGSESNIVNAYNSFINYFNFPNTLKYIKKNEYVDVDKWIEDLKIELDNNRPVYYRGSDISEKGGHAFVCDGYNSFNELHFNWGWDGAANTYCYVYNLIPYGTTYDFSDNQEAIIGITPSNLPDLTPVGQFLSTNSTQASSTIVASCAENNTGSVGVAANVISIYLSSDGILTPDLNGDVWIGEINITSVASNTCSVAYSANVKIPSNTAIGNYYVFFWVDCKQAITESDKTNNYATKTLTVTANTTTLHPVQNLYATAGDSQITLNWSAPISGTPTSYNVYKSTSQNGTYSLVNTSSTSKILTGLTNGTTYWFYVVAVYASGLSDASNKISSTPVTVTTSYPPRNLTATSGNGQVSLSWSAPSSGTPSSYNIYKSTSQTGSYSFYSSSNSTSVIVTGLTNNTTYWFYVTAVYLSDISGSSNVVSATPLYSSSPSNDECSKAKPIDLGTTYSTETLAGATQSLSENSCGTTKTTQITDVWYKFVATTTAHTITVTPSSGLDVVIDLRQGSCNGSNLACKDNGGGKGKAEILTYTNFVIGNTYLIRVYQDGTNTTNDFSIFVSGSSNTNCSITSISESSIIKGSSSFTSTSGSDDIYFNAQPNCTFNVSNNCSWLSVYPESVSANANGQGFINYSIQENTSSVDRQCTFYINVSPVTITQRGVGLPDLTIHYNSYTPTILTQGTLIHVSYTRENIGEGTSPAYNIGVYISNDNVLNPNSDQFIDYSSQGPISAGRSSTSTFTFNIPDCLPCGNYYVFLVIDYEGKIDESNNNNNYDSFPIQITGCTTCTYSVPTSGIQFQSAGGSGNFSVTTTKCCDWTATTTDNFITILNSFGIGSGVVNYNVSPSITGGSRTGTITVAGQNHTIIQNCVQACNNSQSFEWGVRAGSTTLSDAANDLAIDASGNLYMTGKIQGAADFGGGYTLTTPSTAPDIFVSKHNSSGQIQWAVRFGDTDQEYGTGIATDNSGNVYVIGVSANSVTFGNTTLASNGTNEGICFLIKLNSSGVLQWANKINNLYSGSASDIVIDKNNNIFVTGNLNDYTTGTGGGFFITKYNAAGTQSWYKTYGFSSSTKSVYGITVDNLDNILVSGSFMETMTLGTNTLIANDDYFDTDGFITKLDANGVLIWVKQLSSSGRSGNILQSITIDDKNNIYSIGIVDSTAIIGDIKIPLSDKSKTIIIKYDPNGNPVWAKASNEGQQYNQQRIITGNNNNIYFAGCYYESLKIDSFYVSGFGANDNFIGCMDTNGKIKWLKGFGGLKSEGLGGFVSNTTNDIFVAGGFDGTMPLGNTTLTSAGRTDIFLAKFKQCDPPNANITYSGTLAISGNETKSLATEYCSSYTYQWLRNNVNIEGATLPSFNASLSGSYSVLVKSFDGCETLSNAVVLIGYTINPSIYSDEYNISIYPNPTNGKVEISKIVKLGTNCKIEIFDLTGKSINVSTYENFGNMISLDLSAYPKGLYLIKLSNNDVTYHKKVIKK